MEKIKERMGILTKILPYIKKYKWKWVILLFLKIGQSIPALLYPLILKFFIDTVLDQKDFSSMWLIAAIYVGIYLAETITKVLHRIIDNNIFNSMTQDLRIALFHNYLHVPLKKFYTYEISDLVRRINFDVDMVKFFLIGQIFDYLSYGVSAAISIVMMFALDWKLGIIACVMIPLSLLLSGKFEKELEENAETDRKVVSKMGEFAGKVSSSWKEIKANQLEEYEEKRFDDLLSKLLKCRNRNAEIDFRRNAVLDVKEKIFDLLCFYIASGVISMLYGVSAGTVIACIGYYDHVLQGVRDLMQTDADLKLIGPSIKRFMEGLNLADEGDNGGRENNIEDTIGDTVKASMYEVQDLSYSYDDSDHLIIDRLNFTILPGEKVLIDGISGSGKSTLIKLLSGEISPKSGKILLGGADMRDLPEAKIWKNIRKIDTTTYYMDVSIKDFLTMGDENASLARMEEVCKEVCLLDDLKRISSDFSMKIGENGTKLSKGQKQKLALARLLLSEDKIILLDEAFSAIDREDRGKIADAVIKHFKYNTVLCAAHDEEIKRRFEKKIAVK